jgi:hypothetical protein
MRASTITSRQLDLQDPPDLFTHSKEHRGWTVVVAVRRVRERYFSSRSFSHSNVARSSLCPPCNGDRQVHEGRQPLVFDRHRDGHYYRALPGP